MSRHDSMAPMPGWKSEPRPCPFCTIDPRICGCPEGERIVEAHILLGEE